MSPRPNCDCTFLYQSGQFRNGERRGYGEATSEPLLREVTCQHAETWPRSYHAAGQGRTVPAPHSSRVQEGSAPTVPALLAATRHVHSCHFHPRTPRRHPRLQSGELHDKGSAAPSLNTIFKGCISMSQVLLDRSATRFSFQGKW